MERMLDQKFEWHISKEGREEIGGVWASGNKPALSS